jgi:hypothetical protein
MGVFASYPQSVLAWESGWLRSDLTSQPFGPRVSALMVSSPASGLDYVARFNASCIESFLPAWRQRSGTICPVWLAFRRASVTDLADGEANG